MMIHIIMIIPAPTYPTLLSTLEPAALTRASANTSAGMSLIASAIQGAGRRDTQEWG
jgi:hypothetical protein